MRCCPSPLQSETPSPLPTVIIVESTEPLNEINSTKPEDVVSNFFSSYAAKDLTSMQSLLVESRGDVEFELDALESIELIKCSDITNESNPPMTFTDDRYIDAYDRAIVEVTFSIRGSSSSKPSGTYTWWYKLVKEAEASDWLIFEWGV